MDTAGAAPGIVKARCVSPAGVEEQGKSTRGSPGTQETLPFPPTIPAGDTG